MTMPQKLIPLCEPYLSGNEWNYVKECLDSGWVATAGAFIPRFEESVRSYVGATHAVGVASGTAGLHLALLVAGVEPKDEVLVPTITFIAPVNAVRYVGAHPVFMDLDPVTCQVDAKKIAQFLEKECRIENGVCINQKTKRRVKAIIAVHLLGLACEIDHIFTLAKEYKLKVIEDAAEALGVRYKGRHAGTFGDLGVLSFNGNKLVTAGSGGVVLTDDKLLADRVRYFATQAKDNPDTFYHGAVGFNYRLTNLHAAIGLAQMEKVDDYLAKKKRIATFYDEALSQFPELSRVLNGPDCNGSHWLYTFLLDRNQGLKKRDAILKQMHQERIMARPLFHPIHLLPPYKNEEFYAINEAPSLFERGICLPSSVGLNEADLQRTVATLQKVL